MLFKELAETFEALEKTPKRLEMTDILSELFKKADSENADKIVYLLQGRVLPAFEGVEIGLGDKLVESAISKAMGYSVKEIEKMYQKKGDLGTVAEQLASKKKQSSLFKKQLTVNHVYENFMKMAKASGSGSQDLKIKLLAELLNNADSSETKYLVRIPLGKLGLGVGNPTILDALSVKEAGDKSLRERLERGFNVTSDLGLVAKTFYEKGVEAVDHIEMKADHPLLPSLCERLPSAEEIIKKLGKCAVEHKYDGMRVMVNKKGNDVQIYSRRQEKLTHMFPDLVEEIRKHISLKDAILDGEAIAYNELTGEYLPFQQTIQRKRKYDIEKIRKEFPMHVFFFDIMFNGKDLTDTSFIERRKILEKSINKNEVLKLSDLIITDSPEELTKYFNDAVSKGLEGIIAKDLNAPYTVGARKFSWIKLKRSYAGELNDSVDVVIVGYYLGKGKRTKFAFGGLLTCVYDKDDGTFKSIARIGTGFSEAQMKELQEMLSEIKVEKKPKEVDSDVVPDIWVKPKYVVEVMADEITESPMHTAGRVKGIGYALRFPRLLNYRFDRSPEQATSVDEIIKMHKQQKRTEITDSA